MFYQLAIRSSENGNLFIINGLTLLPFFQFECNRKHFNNTQDKEFSQWVKTYNKQSVSKYTWLSCAPSGFGCGVNRAEIPVLSQTWHDVHICLNECAVA